ncbi:MAG: PilN domain-containing protein [Bacillota bacterium]
MINLLPQKYKDYCKFNIDKFLVGGLIVLLLLVPLTYYLKLTARKMRLEEKIRLTESKLKQVNQQNQQLGQIKSDYKDLADRLQLKREVIGQQLDWNLLLKELQLIIPDQVWLSSFIVKEDRKFKLIGYALTDQGLRKMIKGLKSTVYFKGFSVDLTQQEKLNPQGYQAQQVTRFQISGKLEKDVGESNDMVE